MFPPGMLLGRWWHICSAHVGCAVRSVLQAGREEPEPGLWAVLGQVLGCLDSLGSVLQEQF